MSTTIDDVMEDDNLTPEEFWEKFMKIEDTDFEETEESLNKGAEDSGDSDDIQILDKIPKIPPDFIIQGEDQKCAVHLIPTENQITKSKLNVKKPIAEKLEKRFSTFHMDIIYIVCMPHGEKLTNYVYESRGI